MSQAIKEVMQLHFEQQQPYFAKATIVVPKDFVSTIYQRALHAQKDEVHTYGFSKGTTPLLYIEQNYTAILLKHVKEFIFKYFVMSFLYRKLLSKKVLIAGEPRLIDIDLVLNEDAKFHFEISLALATDLSRWKILPFKAPKRKNYKDIDRQVESFVKDEQNNMKKHQNDDGVSIGDWVCFDIALVDENNQQQLVSYGENLWLKIGNEEADSPFQDAFLSKKKGETFYSVDKCFQEYFTSTLNTRYLFNIQIQDVVHNSYFSLEHFRQHFKLRTNKEIHQKLIEVFSYRNDLSLRRAMAEEALKLLIMKHHIEVPNYLVLRQQQIVLESVGTNPDYLVYKTQSSFKDNIRQLALKQAQEMLLIDQLMYSENIVLNPEDLHCYLNLMKRPRTAEFLYFKPQSTKIDGQESPASSVLFEQCCLREKTLNHVIYNLTKK